MTSLTTRIARLAATTIVVLGLAVGAAGPASASYSSWAG